MKRVVTSRQVYHLFAAQSQNSARNAQGNYSFDGVHAYSYAAEIGRIIEKKGKRAVILCTRRYSATTNKAQSYLRSAVAGNFEFVFNVRLDASHKERIAEYKKRIAENHAKMLRSRTRGEWYRVNVLDDAQEMQSYCVFFGLKCPSLDVDKIAAEWAGMEKKQRAERKRLEKKRAAEFAAREKRIEAERVKHRAEWLAGQRETYNAETLLRVNGDEVETSRGARVPMNAARRLFLLYSQNARIEGETVGAFEVAGRGENGALVIGCHTIEAAEIERFAQSQGWV